MTEVEDFKGATSRLLGKLPRLEAVHRREGSAFPRLEIEAGATRYLAFAADAPLLRFHGLVQARDELPSGPWREFAIDLDGNVVDDGRRLRIKRIDWDDGQADRVTRSWPKFSRAKKVKTGA